MSDSSLKKWQKATKVHRQFHRLCVHHQSQKDGYIEKTHYCHLPPCQLSLCSFVFSSALVLDSPHYFCHALSCLCFPHRLRELWELELQKACKGCYGREKKSNTAEFSLSTPKTQKECDTLHPRKWKVITHYQERCFVRRVILCIQSV